MVTRKAAEPEAPAEAEAAAEKSIAEQVREALGELLGSGGVEVEDTSEAKSEPAKDDQLTLRQVEDAIEKRMSARLADLDKKQPPPEASKSTLEPEQAPAPVRHIERWLWGEGKGR
ncbi:MAG: hypothetical protein M0Z69_03995 [Actinomycetota bacterium]|nr:hypothetical protein [Actinomycetota bacterium]